jgi:DUF4097 and DUF4098 domain-containing protein YvlB
MTTLDHPLSPEGNLTVATANWDVEIRPGSDDVVRIRDANGGDPPKELHVERGADSVAVRQPTRLPRIGFGGHSEDVCLAIELPATASVNVVTASGDIRVDGISGEVRLRTASGDLKVGEATGPLVVESVSGDVTVRVADTVAPTVKTVSGDVALDGGVVERVNIATTSGDVVLDSELGAGPHSIATLSGDAVIRSTAGVTVFARTVAGELNSELPHRSDGGPGRRSIVVGDGATELQFRSVSGDLRVVGGPARNGPTIEIPLPPTPPTPPALPLASASPEPAAAGGGNAGPSAPEDEVAGDDGETSRLGILRALENGEIDVAEATARLARLDEDDQ